MTGPAIFLGAFLLFSVQPLAGKITTPLFGGAAAVWCLLLVFFQLTVLAGYATTYGLRRLSPRAQAVAFCG